MEDRERSSEDIRQDIAKEEENLSQAVEEIGERIKEKLDWRTYVQGSPYLTLGVAAGIGYFVSGMFKKRTTPLEQIMDSIAGQIHDSLDGLRAGTGGPGLIKVTLLGIATKAAAGWIKNATSTAGTSGGAGPRPHTGHDSTINPNVTT
jgi:hypothetical protein